MVLKRLRNRNCQLGLAGRQFDRLANVWLNIRELAGILLDEWIATEQQFNVHQVVVDANVCQIAIGELDRLGLDIEVKAGIFVRQLVLDLFAVLVIDQRNVASIDFVNLISYQRKRFAPAINRLVCIASRDALGAVGVARHEPQVRGNVVVLQLCM